MAAYYHSGRIYTLPALHKIQNKIRTRLMQDIFSRYKKYFLPACVLIFSVILLRDYFIPRFQVILGIMTAPFVFRTREKGNFSDRYGIIAVIFIVAYYFLHVKVLFFLALGSLFLFSIESCIGKIGLLPFLFMIVVSPAMHYLVNISTFSIRLELSKWTAEILNFLGTQVINHGNYFVLADGTSFSVDTACIGLNMFNTGLCLALLILGSREQKTGKSATITSIALVFLFAVMLLVLSNFTRMIGIVFLRAMPETFLHDAIGIISLVLYTAVPVYYLSGFLIKRYGKIYAESSSPFRFNRKKVFAAIGLCLLIFFADLQVRNYISQTIKDEKLSKLEIAGFVKTVKEDGVMEFRKDSVLIYIKPANKSYESDHPPNMCWQGSGFSMEEISETKCCGYSIYRARLKKKNKTQYTAWWYDNGSNKTISQWEWRFSKGEPYRTFNVTAASEQELDKLCDEYLRKKLF
jgi:exosortase N